jgi:hypothetical protein
MSPKFISGWGNAISETAKIRLLEAGARSELKLSWRIANFNVNIRVTVSAMEITMLDSHFNLRASIVNPDIGILKYAVTATLPVSVRSFTGWIFSVIPAVRKICEPTTRGHNTTCI